MTAWHQVAKLGDLNPDIPLGVVLDGIAVGIYLLDGEPFAIGDLCPHQRNVRLTTGYVDCGNVECPLHQSQFEIRTGRCLGPPAREDVPSYPVRVENELVFVGIP
jgi:3-phenylpropionate/trans-cinnamate dioxygenase ferredoxin subunit/anthranilate 1,2-dioxygenase ferredoxin subunit